MENIQRAIEHIKIARNTTRGLLFFFPLGMILLGPIMSTYFFFVPGPSKGIFADGIEPNAFSISTLVIVTLGAFIGTWAWVIAESQTRALWPRWTSFIWGCLAGLCIGSVAGFASKFVLLLLVLVIALVAMMYEHYVIFSILAIAIVFSSKYQTFMRQNESQGDH